MKCPVDGTALLITERSGVEIDYCPQCRGVWLDRGELDKIVERSAAAAAPAPVVATVPTGLPLPADAHRDRDRDRRVDRDRDDSDEYPRPVQYDRHGRPKKKRSSIFEDLFDF